MKFQIQMEGECAFWAMETCQKGLHENERQMLQASVARGKLLTCFISEPGIM
jgi:hypothetical protein